MNNALFPIPSYGEQTRIVAKIERLEQFCDSLEEQINQNKADVENLLQAVLKEAFENQKEYPVKEEKLSLAVESE